MSTFFMMLCSGKGKTRREKRIFIALILSLIPQLLIFNPSYGAGEGTTGAAFLKDWGGGKPVAMGETYSAISDDATAPYWNPAGLTLIKGKELSTMYTWVSGYIPSVHKF